MPTTPRKSSLGGTRRGPHKAHIPYRGDNPGVGKKTGIQVNHVDRDSDGFEPFENLMQQQADGVTPPHLVSKKRKKSMVLDDDFDEDGEQSMDIDSPIQVIANTRRTGTPGSHSRAGSSTRPVARTSNVDFDRVPSPKPRSVNGRRISAYTSPGPSSLSKSFRADLSPDPPDDDYMDAGGGGMEDDFDAYDQPESSSPGKQNSPRKSFGRKRRDEEDDDEESEDDDPHLASRRMIPSPKKVKGKSELNLPPTDEGSDEGEDDIVQALDDVDIQPPSEEEEEQPDEDEPSPPKRKKAKAESKAKPATKMVKERVRKKENREVREGIRRSAREPIRPLEWWRLEKVVYGRGPVGSNSLVPHIKEIHRIPEEPTEPLGAKRKQRKGRAKSRSQTAAPHDRDGEGPVVLFNPELGWDDETPEMGKVYDFDGGHEVTRRITFTSANVEVQPAGGGEWSFQKIFGDGDFIASGQLHIPPKGRKPSKGTKDNTYIFYIIEGAVNLRIGETGLILATGAMFMIPRGNTYFIENIANRTTKLFFTQARKVPDPGETGTPGRSTPGLGRNTPGGGRSSSLAGDSQQTLVGRAGSSVRP